MARIATSRVANGPKWRTEMPATSLLRSTSKGLGITSFVIALEPALGDAGASLCKGDLREFAR